MGKKVLSQQVMRWPEFKAFCERLEVDLSLPLLSVTIRVAHNEIVEVQQTFMGRDAQTEGE